MKQETKNLLNTIFYKKGFLIGLIIFFLIEFFRFYLHFLDKIYILIRLLTGCTGFGYDNGGFCLFFGGFVLYNVFILLGSYVIGIFTAFVIYKNKKINIIK